MSDLNLKLLITATNDGAIRSVNQVDQSLRGVGTSARNAIADLAHISGVILLWQQFASSPVEVARSLVRAADEMKGVDARVRLASSSFAEFNRNLASIRATAQASGTELSSVASLFNRIATPIRDMGGSAADAQVAVTLVGNALRISGATAAESSAAMLQFAQAMGSGVLRGEELNSILENAPRLAQAIASGLGVTIGELKKLGEQGALTSAQVLKAVRSQQSALADEAARLPQTVGQAWTNLGESAKQVAAGFDKASGATAGMASGINALATNLPAIASALGEISIVAAVALGSSLVGALNRTVGANIAAMTSARALAAEEVRVAEAALAGAVAVRASAVANLQGVQTAIAYAGASELAALADERRVAALRLLAANQAVGAASTALSAAQVAGTAASVGLLGRAMGLAAVAGRGLLALFGGPLGLAITAITAGVLAWQHFADKSKAATAETGQSLTDLTTQFNNFSGKSGVEEATKALSELKDKAAEARDKLASPIFRNSQEGKTLAADLSVAETAIDKFEQRVTKFNDSHAKERGLLGLDKLKPDVGGLVGDDVLKQLNAFSVLYKDFINNAIGDNNRLKASALEVKAALNTLLAAAKTPAEFNGLVSRIGEALKASPKDATLKSQLENAIEGRMQAELKALNGLVSGLEARAQRTQALFASTAGIALAQFNQAAALAKVASELNNDTSGVSRIDTRGRNADVAVAVQGANLQMAALEQVAARKRELVAQGLKDAQAAARDELDAARLTSRQKVNEWRGELAKGVITKEELADRTKKLAADTEAAVSAGRNNGKQAEIDAAKQTREVDAETAQKRIAIAENLYKTVQGKAAEALASYKQYAQQVIDLDKRIANNRLDTSAAIGALQRSDMSPKEQVQSLRDELAQVQAATATAGSPDQQLELLNRQKGLAQQIGSASGDGINKKDQIKEGSAELERIGAEADAILQAQRAAAKEAADQQLQSYQQMTQAMNELATQITALNEQSAIKIKPEIDQASLDGAINAVRQAFANVTIPINVQAVGLPAGNPGPTVEQATRADGSPLQGFAYGGALPGSASHDRADNMMYWGTPGEWVIQRPAVRHYGAAFIAAVNAMKLPKFATGGQLGASAIDRLAIPSLGGASGGRGSNLAPANFYLDGQRYPVQANSDVLAQLASHFSREALRKGGRR